MKRKGRGKCKAERHLPNLPELVGLLCRMKPQRHVKAKLMLGYLHHMLAVTKSDVSK
jgi:hypothetical protein